MTMHRPQLLCVHCAHGVLETGGLMRRCHAPQAQQASAVYGSPFADPCYIARTVKRPCGPDAKFYQPKEATA